MLSEFKGQVDAEMQKNLEKFDAAIAEWYSEVQDVVDADPTYLADVSFAQAATAAEENSNYGYGFLAAGAAIVAGAYLYS